MTWGWTTTESISLALYSARRPRISSRVHPVASQRAATTVATSFVRWCSSTNQRACAKRVSCVKTESASILDSAFRKPPVKPQNTASTTAQRWPFPLPSRFPTITPFQHHQPCTPT
uniref:(northern house mosquito) hypothetical protein n=1 Tax=Culex pipiens TaxID=7175 RepID=A0A8D8FV50_CULPI